MMEDEKSSAAAPVGPAPDRQPGLDPQPGFNTSPGPGPQPPIDPQPTPLAEARTEPIPAAAPAPPSPPPISAAVQKFKSCRWRCDPDDGEFCTHRDVLPFAGKEGFVADSWCPDCAFYKLRRTPKKRERLDFTY